MSVRHRVRPPRVAACLTALVLAAIMLGAAAPAGATPTVDRVIDTSAWRKPSPDPSGIAYLRRSGRFLVVDGEVEETRVWRRANMWLINGDGVVLRSFKTTRYSSEPADVAVYRRTIYIIDDDRDRIFRVRRGRDRRLGTRDDSVVSFSTRGFGVRDPEGIAYGRGSLFIAEGLDGGSPAIYRVSPGRDRRFEGGGDDVIRSFDAPDLGLTDPEGVAHAAGSLFIVGRGPDDVIVQTTLSGHLIGTVDLSGTGIVHASGISVVRDGDTLVALITDRRVDNATDPDENDGQIVVLTLPTSDATA
jgi:hypothetical protein